MRAELANLNHCAVPFVKSRRRQLVEVLLLIIQTFEFKTDTISGETHLTIMKMLQGLRIWLMRVSYRKCTAYIVIHYKYRYAIYTMSRIVLTF